MPVKVKADARKATIVLLGWYAIQYQENAIIKYGLQMQYPRKVCQGPRRMEVAGWSLMC